MNMQSISIQKNCSLRSFSYVYCRIISVFHVKLKKKQQLDLSFNYHYLKPRTVASKYNFLLVSFRMPVFKYYEQVRLREEAEASLRRGSNKVLTVRPPYILQYKRETEEKRPAYDKIKVKKFKSFFLIFLFYFHLFSYPASTRSCSSLFLLKLSETLFSTDL